LNIRKLLQTAMHQLAKSIISYLWVSYFLFVFSWQCKSMLFTNKNACSDVIGACA